VDLTEEESEWSAPGESLGQAAAGGGSVLPVGAVAGGICGVIGAIVIGIILYVVLRKCLTGSYDPKSGANGDRDGETDEVEFGGESFEQTTLVTFHDQTTITETEQMAFAGDATETFAGDIASLMVV
jgi:hypothetical protein